MLRQRARYQLIYIVRAETDRHVSVELTFRGKADWTGPNSNQYCSLLTALVLVKQLSGLRAFPADMEESDPY